MGDREMLELAAKAAGFEVSRSRLDDPIMQDLLISADYTLPPHNTFVGWNPLIDDGDALRLAVKLKLPIDTAASHLGAPDDTCNCYLHKTEPYAATRRAITRAAAEIGKMKGEK